MPVKEIRHAPRCKFCRHEKVADINELCERRSKGEIGPEEWTREVEALGVENPNAGDGWKKHWSRKGHYFYETPSEAAESAEEKEKEETVRNLLTAAALELFGQVLGDRWREEGRIPTPDQILDIQRALYTHELELRLAAGLPSGLTHDQVLKAIGEGTKRKQNQAQNELLRALGGGIGMVFEKALGGGSQGELPPGTDVIIIEDAPEVAE